MLDEMTSYLETPKLSMYLRDAISMRDAYSVLATRLTMFLLKSVCQGSVMRSSNLVYLVMADYSGAFALKIKCQISIHKKVLKMYHQFAWVLN